MCGIVAIYSYNKNSSIVERDEILRIRDHMVNRGPDAKGMWFSANSKVGLAHRRLSIIDLSNKAEQPMQSSKGESVITFNGEIYNYKQLRSELEGKGYVFNTESDTEVLLNLYDEMGETMLSKLRGMFAFSLWNKKSQSMLIARDSYGIKPLYYSDNGKCIRIASQVKALIYGGGISKEVSLSAEAGFYVFGYVPEPHTIYKEIKSLPAGSYMVVSEKSPPVIKKYLTIPEIYYKFDSQTSCKDVSSLESVVRNSLYESVEAHLTSDVPVGVFLSAGIDSSVLTGVMSDVLRKSNNTSQQEIQSITLEFDEYRGTSNDESILAEKVSKTYGTRHTERLVTQDEFESDIHKFVSLMDQPTIDGINTWYASKAAKELDIKVAISGLGGDEVFGGYPSYQDVPKWSEWGNSTTKSVFVANIFESIVGFLSKGSNPLGIHPKTAGFLKYTGDYYGAYLLKRGLYLPHELKFVMGKERALEGLMGLVPLSLIERNVQPFPSDPFSKVSILESSMYMKNQLLRDSDWASMAHSVEVRTPLVDIEFLKQISPHLRREGMAKSGKELLGSIPDPMLPNEILNRPKTGFTTPVLRWINNSKSLDLWKEIPELCNSNVPWQRRWSYQLYKLWRNENNV